MQAKRCEYCQTDHRLDGVARCPLARVGTVLKGKYCLEQVIGSGGAGVVYRAHLIDSHLPVAVKLLHYEAAQHPQVVERFVHEGTTAASVNHPGITSIIDVGRTKELIPFLVMELLEGRTLAEWLDFGPFPVTQTVAIAAEMLDALAMAHARDIVHRDLKPENIFLDTRMRRARVKILDFGIAKSLQTDDLNLTSPGEILGTPRYMSPEQLESSDVDRRTDIYSAGAILYHLLTGDPVVDGSSTMQVLSQILMGKIRREPRDIRSDVPTWLNELVARCLASNPGHRPQTVEEVIQTLENGIGFEHWQPMISIKRIQAFQRSSRGEADDDFLIASSSPPGVHEPGGILLL